MQTLAEAGEDVNKGVYPLTPLEAAAERGDMAIVEYLLSKNAQNPQKAYGRAISSGHIDVAKYIVDAASLDVNDSAGAFGKYLNDETMPFEERMRNVRDMTGGKLNSPYLLALVQPEHYQEMIDFFDIRLTGKADAPGRSILHVAAYRNNYDLAAYLLDNNFDINTLDPGGHTALFYAITVYGPSIDWTKPVIEDEKTAKINFTSDMPYYGNAGSIQQRQVALVGLLLDKGIDVNQQDAWGWTVLHFASAGYPPGLQELLIARGSSKDLKTAFGRNSADILALRK